MSPLAELRKHLLAIYGQSAAFNLIDAAVVDFEELKAAKETGQMIHSECREAIRILNLLQKEPQHEARP